MNNPLVSIIIPTYGGNSSLKRALISVLNQGYPNIEIIVVDDNNPDSRARRDTEKIISQFLHQPNLIYIQHEKNKNGSAARNTGVRNSSGEYISFLDDDDVFLPLKVSKQVTYLESHKEFQAVYCWRYEGERIIRSDLTGNLSESLLDLTFTPCTPSIMIRRICYETLNGFDESYIRHQDFEFLLRFFKQFEMGVVKEPLIRIIGNGVDNQPKGEKAIEVKKKFMDAFQNEIAEIDSRRRGFKKRVYANHYSGLMIKLLRYGNIKLAIKMYFTDGYKGGMLFWKQTGAAIIKICEKKINRQKGRNQ